MSLSDCPCLYLQYPVAVTSEYQQFTVEICKGEMTKPREELSHDDPELEQCSEEQDHDQEVGCVVGPDLQGQGPDCQEVEEDADEHDEDVEHAEGDCPAGHQTRLDIKLVILHCANHLTVSHWTSKLRREDLLVLSAAGLMVVVVIVLVGAQGTEHTADC